MGKSGKGIPEDWEDFTSISKQIPGTRFIAFKVPLKDALLNNLDVTVEFFDVNSLVEHCPNLGLVIDLTNTDRYYDSTEFQEHNVSYYKLKTFGHFIPSDRIVFKFFEVVEGFLSNNRNNDKLIGVHCTHGVTRTGYLIIRYMIQQLNMKPDEALSAFNTARGHKLEKEHYLEDLKKAKWPKPPRFITRTRPMHREIHQQDPLFDESLFDNGSNFEGDFIMRNQVMSGGPLFRERPVMGEYEQEALSYPYQEEVMPPRRNMPNCDRPRPFPVPLLPRPSGPHSYQDYLDYDYDDHIGSAAMNQLSHPLLEHNSVDYHHSQGIRPLLEPPASLSVLDPRRLDYETVSQNRPIFRSRESRNIPERSDNFRAMELRVRHEVEPNIRPILDDPLPLTAFRRPIGEASVLGKPYYEQIGDVSSPLESNSYGRDNRAFESRSLSSLLHDDIPQRHFRESNINRSQLYQDDYMYSRRAPPQNSNPLIRERSHSLFERVPDLRSLPLEPQRSAFSSGSRNVYSSDYDFPPRMRSSRFLPY